MEGLRTQPDLHDLLRMEDDVLSPKGDVSPERLQHSLNSSASKINTPAKVLMVGEPVQVKTEERQEKAAGNTDGATNPDLSGSSNEELADGIRTPSPETAAAMESFIADDDLTAASPKLGAKPPTPVSFTASANTNKLILRPQTSSVTTVKANQPISIAGKKFMVATQPLQVMRKDGAGGPIFTKLVVKRTTTATAATHKSPVVFTKTRGLSPAKNSLKSGSIVLSPIKGGFKIPISPIKSPIKVSVIPPSNTKKMPALGKPITVPISMPQLQQKIQPGASNTRTVMNGLLSQGGKNFISQQHITVQNRQPTAPNQSLGTNRQVIQQLHVIQSPSQSIQDSQGAKIQYVQILPTANNTQHPTIRSNQGQPITFTSMSPLNGGNLSLNQPGGTIAFLPQNIQKAQPQSSSSNIERQPQTVKVTIPGQATHQIKPQRLIMPATSAPQARAGITPITPGSVIPQGYAMVPVRNFEELTKRINVQNSFCHDATIHPVPKPLTSGKIGANGKLKKPCNCTKSQCLKLYCECFANGQFCDECNCINCFNNLDHEAERSKAVKQCLERNPAAFRPKIGRGKDDNRTHQKGCNCKRSGCLKNYCECYEARIPCTSKCKCIGCKNYEDTGERRSLMSLADAAEVRVQQQTAAKTKLSNQIGDIKPAARTTITGERLPYTFFTPEVIEATCTCLLAQAEEAEKTNRPMAVAEAMILEEFGRCVMQIIQSAGKAKVSHFN